MGGMQFITGTVVQGKVVLEGASLPEGAQVAVLADASEQPVRLPPRLQEELDDALVAADAEEGLPAEQLLEQLRRYG